MTTNNEVKAPRPCTLWGRTFDSNLVAKIATVFIEAGTGWYIRIEDAEGGILAAIGLQGANKQKHYQEAILAIASAQRPWLKAEGFEFVQGEVVELLYKDGSRCFGKFDGINAFNTCWSDGFIYYEDRHSKENNLETINISLFNAFKPISDSQEAWDALAGVEVYKEGV